MSSTGTYTPGPWSYEEPDAVGLPHLRAANGDAIATFLRDPWNSSDIPLIAAAPELLEVIREAVDSADREMSKGRKASPGLATWLEKARAVLAKARADEGKENA